jgi:hypothetical protein
MKNGKSLQYYIRVLHRNLGFLALCMTVVYALSGIVLTHRAGNFMKKSTLVEKTISQGLDQKGLEKELKMRKFKAGEAQDGFIAFNEDGKYEISTGKVTYSQSDYVWPMDKLVALHKTSSCRLVRDAVWRCALLLGCIFAVHVSAQGKSV